MGLFDRSLSINKNKKEFDKEDLDILLGNVDKLVQDISLSESGGEKEALQENIEKDKLSFSQQFGASKSLAEGFREAPIVGMGGRFSFTPDFEEKFAAYIGSRYAVAVSNGTAALHLSILALGIKKGQKVVTAFLLDIS